VSQAAISVHGVWKKFRRGERHDSLRDLIPATVRKVLRRGARPELEDTEFWAVRDVSFEVKPGEALGIIGANGAGKSTILKLLTRILRPTRGHCEVRGRVGALIEVAAGFHPDLTGRENVYLQGSIMGMRQAEIASAFDQIVDFSGISEFIDTPVKRYSSGMNARLGFSIAAHLNPDVLLVDEVLAVGDVAFQERCVARMRALLARGIPVVFISHNLPAIVELCTRGIVIDRGGVVFDGAPAEAAATYRQVLHTAPAESAAAGAARKIRIAAVEIGSAAHSAPGVVPSGGDVRIRICYEAAEAMRAHFAVDIHTAEGLLCTGINTRMDGSDFGVLRGRGLIELSIPRLPLLPGCYVVSVGILDHSTFEPLDLRLRTFPLTVSSPRPDFGLVYVERGWEHRSLRSFEPEPASGRRAHPQPRMQTGALS
jgi:lipopolysaccharide transport system ATP-binding protein